MNRKVYAQVEFNSGSGAMLDVEVDADIPLHYRWYYPIKDINVEDPHHYGATLLDIVSKDPRVATFEHYTDSVLKSILLVECHDSVKELCGLSVEEAQVKATEMDLISRIVVIDGKQTGIEYNVSKGRVNLWVDRGEIYRAEKF